MSNKAAAGRNQRLASLDILRGLDLFVLLFLQPVILAVIDGCGMQQTFAPLLHQLDHEVWVGFRVWDLVMPLFLFMVGTSMPFAFARYSDPTASRRPLYRRIARRVVLLFLFGMIVQGNLLSFDPSAFKIYTNTLQAIAAGYLLAAIIMLSFPLRGQIAATAALLIIYSIPMMAWGDWTAEGNFANMIDSRILGSFRGDPTYTWIWSSLTFGATVMMGAFAGQIIRSSARSRLTALRLAAIGAATLLAGVALTPVIPMIKRIWSTSMTLYSGGWCFLLMALFYWVIDVKGRTLGLGWLKIYGMNAILAYMIGEVISFRSVVESVSYGLRPILGEAYSAWLTFGNATILLLILAFLYRHKIFLKV